MLRALLVICGAGLLCVALWLFAFGGIFAGSGFWPLVLGCLLLLATLFERHYRSKSMAATGNWQKTGERFRDPSTGKTVDVYYNPSTGERSYRDIDPTRS